jgi:hypothetical protein
MNASNDPRWLALKKGKTMCAGCGEIHSGLFDLASPKPDYWSDGDEPQPNGAVLNSQHVLTGDLCIINGGHYFVRAVLRLPIIGLPNESFGYGVWAALSKENFDLYLAEFDEGLKNNVGPWPGWLSNAIVGYPDTMNMKCKVYPQPLRKRPLIHLDDSDHPLAVEQIEGVTLDRLFEIFSVNGHLLVL